MQLDLDFIRSYFPAFREPSLAQWSFFENAGGSYTCQQVIDRLFEFYTQTKVQPYYPFPASTQGGKRMDESYTRLAAYLNVSEAEISFGPSTSQNVYVLANAMRPLWQAGDEIVLSNQDHEANAGAWRRLEDAGIVIKEWCIDAATGLLDVANLDDLIGSRTRMIAFPHVSNIIGHVNPVKQVTEKAHEVGAIAVVDGVSYAPHGLPDIAALGADIYLFSLYKTWGPHLGLMYVSGELRKKLGNQSHFFHRGKTRNMLTPAGPDHAQIAAVAGIVDYFDGVYEHHFDDQVDSAAKGRCLYQLFSQHEKYLLKPLLNFLKGREDVRIIGPDDASLRVATVAVLPLEKSVTDVSAALNREKLMVGSGDFYGVRPLTAMGIALEPGVLRMSFVHYTSMDDITRLVAGLERALDD